MHALQRIYKNMEGKNISFERLINKYHSLPLHLKASFWFLISGFFAKGISIISTPIFTRLLTTAEYGKVSVFNSWYGIFAVFITLNLSSGVYIQGLIKFNTERKAFSSALQSLTLFLTIVWLLVYYVFHDIINEITSLTTAEVLIMIMMSWLTASFQFWAVEKRVDLKYRPLVTITMIATFLQVFVGIILVLLLDDKVLARILGMLIVQICFYSWCFFAQISKGKVIYSKKIWKYVLAFNIPLIPHYLSMTVLNNADRIMISNLVGDKEAGIYNLAYAISQIMIVINIALLQTIEPWLYKKIKSGQVLEIKRIAYPSFIIIALANILIMMFAPEVISFFAPSSYSDAINVIPPVAMSSFFMFLYTFFAVFEFYYEKTKYIMIATTLGAVLNILLNYIFINKYGYIAAGYTTLFCYIFFAIFHYAAMKKICKDHLNGVMPYNQKILLLMSFGFVLIGLLILITYSNTILRYSFIGGIIVLIIFYRSKIIRLIKNIRIITRQ